MSLLFTQILITMKVMRYDTKLFRKSKIEKHSVNHSLWTYTFRLGINAMNFSKKNNSHQTKGCAIGTPHGH